MNKPRIRPTRLAAADLGLSYTAFLALRSDPAFPRPLHQRGHHLYWDMKAIELYLDKKNGIAPQSANWGAILTKGLAGGEGDSALSH